MNQKYHSDIIDAKDYSVEELRQMAFEETGRLSRELAVALLARKEYKKKLDDLRQILEDENSPIKVRHAAALGLGRTGSTQAVDVLKSVNVRQDFVQRGIAQALSEASLRAAGTESQDVGKTMRRKGALRTATFPHLLVAYRKGEYEERISFPASNRLLSLDEKASESVPFQTVETSEAAQVVDDLRRFDPELELRPEQAVGMHCAGRDLMFLMDRESGEKGHLQKLLEQKAVPGILAIRFGVESEAWSPRYYLLTQPARRKGHIQVMLVTPKGKVSFAGMASVDGERAEFTLQAVDEPGMSPAEIAGVFEDGILQFTQIRTMTETQPRLVPKERN